MQIDDDRLHEYAGEIDLAPPTPDPGQVPTGDDEATAGFVVSLDAINFGSGYFPHIRKRPGLSGCPVPYGARLTTRLPSAQLFRPTPSRLQAISFPMRRSWNGAASWIRSAGMSEMTLAV